MNTSNNSILLVVEDNDLDVELLHLYYQRAEFDLPVVRAEHGEHALQILTEAFSADHTDDTEQPVFIVLLDLNMPRMNGLEFLEAIREKSWKSRLTIHILSTSDHPNDRSIAEQHQVASYSQKPVSLDLLNRIMSAA